MSEKIVSGFMVMMNGRFGPVMPTLFETEEQAEQAIQSCIIQFGKELGGGSIFLYVRKVFTVKVVP